MPSSSGVFSVASLTSFSCWLFLPVAYGIWYSSSYTRNRFMIQLLVSLTTSAAAPWYSSTIRLRHIVSSTLASLQEYSKYLLNTPSSVHSLSFSSSYWVRFPQSFALRHRILVASISLDNRVIWVQTSSNFLSAIWILSSRD